MCEQLTSFGYNPSEFCFILHSGYESSTSMTSLAPTLAAKCKAVSFLDLSGVFKYDSSKFCDMTSMFGSFLKPCRSSINCGCSTVCRMSLVIFACLFMAATWSALYRGPSLRIAGVSPELTRYRGFRQISSYTFCTLFCSISFLNLTRS